MKKRYIKDMHIYLYVDTLTMKKKMVFLQMISFNPVIDSGFKENIFKLLL